MTQAHAAGTGRPGEAVTQQHRAASRWTSRRPVQRGQALLEFAVTSMLTVTMLLVTLQVSLIVAQAFGAAHVARMTARWLAVRIDTTDATLAAQARTFATGLPGLGATGLTSITASPACAALVSGKCTSRNQGDAVTVSVVTSLAPVLFLPTTFGVDPLRVRLPTAMPAIAFTVLLE